MAFIKILRCLKELGNFPFFFNNTKTEVFSFTKRNSVVASSPRFHSQINCTIPDSNKHLTLYKLNFEMGHRSPAADFNIVILNHLSSHSSRDTHLPVIVDISFYSYLLDNKRKALFIAKIILISIA